ncbi:MAG: hypothetical protein KKA84_12095 [Bacteroidetes bacterium]|nr:hypothetical protein [Bacteroidota bacterium]
MTLQHIIETVQMTFPRMGITQLLSMSNQTEEKFASETGIIRKVISLTEVETDLPTDFEKIDNYKFIVENGSTIETLFKIVMINGKFVVIQIDNTTITAIPSPVTSIELEYYAKPTPLTGKTSSLTIPEKYSDAIIAKILEKLYARTPVTMASYTTGTNMLGIDRNMVRYWKSEYREQVIDAKKEANSRNDKSEWHFQGTDDE